MKKVTKIILAAICLVMAFMLTSTPFLTTTAQTPVPNLPNLPVGEVWPDGWSKPNLDASPGIHVITADGEIRPTMNYEEFIGSRTAEQPEERAWQSSGGNDEAAEWTEEELAAWREYQDNYLRENFRVVWTGDCGSEIYTRLDAIILTAHLDYDAYYHNPALQESILRARAILVYCETVAWTVDGQVSIVRADGTIEELPEFSDLFPNWCLEQISAAQQSRDTASDNVQEIIQPHRVIFPITDTYFLPLQINTQAPHIFGHRLQFAVTVQIRIDQIFNQNNGNGVNIGVNNMDLPGNPCIGWVPNLSEGEIVVYDIPARGFRMTRASMTRHASDVTITHTSFSRPTF